MYTTGPAPAEEGPGYDELPVFLGVALLAMARTFGHGCFMGRKSPEVALPRRGGASSNT